MRKEKAEEAAGAQITWPEGESCRRLGGGMGVFIVVIGRKEETDVLQANWEVWAAAGGCSTV